VRTYQDTQLDALGDATRRAILSRLMARPMAVTDRAAGNRRLYQLNPEGFATVREYLEQFWGQALDAFRRKAEETSHTTKKKARKKEKK